MSQPDFTIDVSQNEYLPGGGAEVSAIVTVTSADGSPGTAPGGTGAGGTGAGGTGAEIIIVDCSGSMGYPQTKIAQARAATAAAIDVIRDGVAFAVIAGSNKAAPVFPLDYGLAVADDQSRYLAKQAVAGLLPRGGAPVGPGPGPAHPLLRTPP